jgi:hypothetical protein
MGETTAEQKESARETLTAELTADLSTRAAASKKAETRVDWSAVPTASS